MDVGREGQAVVVLTSRQAGASRLAVLLGGSGFVEADGRGRHTVDLEGHGYRWYRAASP